MHVGYVRNTWSWKKKKEEKRKKKKGEERNNTRFTRDDTRHAIAWITHSAELIRLMTSWIRADRHENVASLQFRKFLILHVLYIYIYIWVDDINRNSLLSRTDYRSENLFLRAIDTTWLDTWMIHTGYAIDEASEHGHRRNLDKSRCGSKGIWSWQMIPSCTRMSHIALIIE